MSIPTPNPNQDKIQERRALIIAMVFLVAIAANLLLSLSQGFQTGAWQHFVRAGLVVIFGIYTITATIWIRSGRAEEGIGLILRAFLLTLIGTTLLLSGFGLILALIELVLAESIIAFTSSKEKRNLSSLFIVIAALLTFSLDLLPLNYRIPAPPAVKSALPIMAGLVIVTIIIIAIRLSWDLFRSNLTGSHTITTEQRERNAFYFSIAMVVIYISSTTLFDTFTELGDIFPIIPGVATIGALIAFISIWVNRKGKYILSVQMLIMTQALITVFVAVLLTEVGLALGTSLILITFAIGSYALPTDKVRPLYIGAGLVAGFVILLDVFMPFERFRIAGVGSLSYKIVLGLALVFGILIMLQFRNYTLRTKVLISFIGVSLITVSAITAILVNRNTKALEDDAFAKLSAVQTIKHNQIVSYLDERKDDIEALSVTVDSLFHNALHQLQTINTLKYKEITTLFKKWDVDIVDFSVRPGLISSMDKLSSGFQDIGTEQARDLYLGKGDIESAGDDSTYSAAHQSRHNFFTEYTQIHGYKNLILIDTRGNLVYSIHKGDSFGTNLVSGLYKDTNLAELYSNLINAKTGETYIADIALFEGEYVMFIGTPIYQGSTLKGILVYQIDTQQINDIMNTRTDINLGKTGESFLVAQETDGRVTFRNDRHIVGGGKFVIGYDLSDIVPPFMHNALAGASGSNLSISGVGTSAITAYRPLNIKGVNWAILSRIDGEEALVPTPPHGEKDFLTLYKETYGYYDVFLIHPNGDIFYSVEKESDYHTNILTGEYKDSNLGTLVTNMKQKLTFNFVDFAFYTPSGKPAAFVGAPLLHDGSDIELYVVAQLPLTQFDSIMTENTGLGESGETYLIGPDQLWRSDSRFLDDLGVKTTVLEENFKVDTVASRSALSGDNGQGIIQDYRDTSVLSVWSSIEVAEPDEARPEGQHWAVIAQINESEIAEPAQEAVRLATGIALLIMIMVAGTAVGLTQVLISPIINLTGIAEEFAKGNLKAQAPVETEDEVGTLSLAFNSMAKQLRNTLEGLELRVAERTRALETSTEVSRRLSTILDKNELVSEVVNQLVSAFGYYYAHIYLFEEDKNTLIMKGGTGEAGKVLLSRGHTIPKGRGLVGRAAENNQVVLVGDTLNEEGWLPNDLLPETRSEIAIPIAIGDEVLGVFDVQHNVVNGLTDEDAELMQSIANQVAVALQNIESYEATQHRAKHEALISKITQEIQSTTSVEDALKVAVRELGRVLDADTSIKLK